MKITSPVELVCPRYSFRARVSYHGRVSPGLRDSNSPRNTVFFWSNRAPFFLPVPLSKQRDNECALPCRRASRVRVPYSRESWRGVRDDGEKKNRPGWLSNYSSSCPNGRNKNRPLLPRSLVSSPLILSSQRGFSRALASAWINEDFICLCTLFFRSETRRLRFRASRTPPRIISFLRSSNRKMYRHG